MGFFSGLKQGFKSFGSTLKSGIGKVGSGLKAGIGKLGGVSNILKGIGQAAQVGGGIAQAFSPMMTPQQQEAASQGFGLAQEGAGIASRAYETGQEIHRDVKKGGVGALPDSVRKAMERKAEVEEFVEKVREAKRKK